MRALHSLPPGIWSTASPAHCHTAWYVVECETKGAADARRRVVLSGLKDRASHQESPNGPGALDRRGGISRQHDTVGDVLSYPKPFGPMAATKRGTLIGRGVGAFVR
jgi:hypothetical protein